MFHDLGTLRTVASHDPEVTRFYETLVAEVEDRVRQGISASEFQTCRLSYEGEALHYAEDFVGNVARRYGASFVAGYGCFAHGIWDIDPEGRWTVSPPTLAEMGVNLRTREEAIRLLAEGFVMHQAMFRNQRGWEKVGELLHRAEDWKCQGMVLHLDMGCHNQVGIRVEAKRALEEHGIPTLTFNCSNGDPRDFTPAAISDQMESFLERLGLKRLGESEAPQSQH